MLICIDPGHSIDTPGKCAPDKSYYEHVFNLEVGLYLKAELERCGFSVIMTRETEKEKGAWVTDHQRLSGRCRIANDAGADYLISIHTNAAGSGWSAAQGLSAHIVAKGGQAEKLAAAIRAEAVPALGCVDRGTRVDNFAMVRDTDMPAVLMEYGFHTNREEVERLKSSAYRCLCAQATARGVCRHAGWRYMPEEGREGEGKPMITVAELQKMGYRGVVF